MGHLADRILALHGWAALAVVFWLPALEASVFVGVVVPGEIAVLLGGVLAFQHRVSLPAVTAAAITGAIGGDTIGYLVGRRWGRTILHSSLGRLVRAEHLDRAERYLATRGGPAVFVGRFTAALRALIPGLAGMAHLRYRTFAAYNALGGAVWATGFVLLGYAAGSGWRHVEHTAGQASLLLLVLVIVVGAVVLAARWIARHPDRVRALADRQLDRPRIRRIRGRSQRQLAFLARRLQPQGALGLTLTLTVLVLAAAGWAFGALLQDVLAHDELALVDAPVQRLFVTHREAWLTLAMRGITNLGLGPQGRPVDRRGRGLRPGRRVAAVSGRALAHRRARRLRARSRLADWPAHPDPHHPHPAHHQHHGTRAATPAGPHSQPPPHPT